RLAGALGPARSCDLRDHELSVFTAACAVPLPLRGACGNVSLITVLRAPRDLAGQPPRRALFTLVVGDPYPLVPSATPRTLALKPELLDGSRIEESPARCRSHRDG